MFTHSGEDYEILGRDSRKRIRNTRKVPFRYICKLEIRGHDVCTGTLIGPNKVLTAAHCLLSHNNLRPRDVAVIPGKRGAASSSRSEPFGYAFGEKFDINPRFRKARNDYQRVKTDYAVITLDQSIGDKVGWWDRFRVLSADRLISRNLNTAGYPLDKSGGNHCYWDYNEVVHVSGSVMTFMHDINDGQSGSPLWIRWKNSRAIAGIVSTHPITLMSLSKRAKRRLAHHQ